MIKIKEIMTTMTNQIPCPHCHQPVSPASLMGKLSALKRKDKAAHITRMNAARAALRATQANG